MDYTPILDNIQIRDMVYLCIEDEEKNKNNPPKEFDVVQWHEINSIETINMTTNNMTTKKYCYSLGKLVWDAKEECFDFNSCGLRWLEAKPSERAIDMIIGFCEMMKPVLKE